MTNDLRSKCRAGNFFASIFPVWNSGMTTGTWSALTLLVCWLFVQLEDGCWTLATTAGFKMFLGITLPLKPVDGVPEDVDGTQLISVVADGGRDEVKTCGKRESTGCVLTTWITPALGSGGTAWVHVGMAVSVEGGEDNAKVVQFEALIGKLKAGASHLGNSLSSVLLTLAVVSVC